MSRFFVWFNPNGQPDWPWAYSASIFTHQMGAEYAHHLDMVRVLRARPVTEAHAPDEPLHCIRGEPR